MWAALRAWWRRWLRQQQQLRQHQAAQEGQQRLVRAQRVGDVLPTDQQRAVERWQAEIAHGVALLQAEQDERVRQLEVRMRLFERSLPVGEPEPDDDPKPDH